MDRDPAVDNYKRRDGQREGKEGREGRKDKRGREERKGWERWREEGMR